MSTFAASLSVETCAGARVDSNRLADDKTIFDQTANLMPETWVNQKFFILKIVRNIPAVSVRDALVFVGVEPDLIFAAFHNGRREALLQDESRHNDLKQSKSDMKKLNF